MAVPIAFSGSAPREPLLTLRGFGVAAGRRVILAEIDLDLPARGIAVLMGPAGAGKSLLLRSLCGLGREDATLRSWGTARYGSRPLGKGAMPALVEQNVALPEETVLESVLGNLAERGSLPLAEKRRQASCLLAEHGLAELAGSLDDLTSSFPLAVQRRLAILGVTVGEPALLCVDEPTDGLSDADALALLAQLAHQAERRSLLVVTRNQQHAQVLGGNLALLAGGRIQERRPVPDFFAAPESVAGRAFVCTGGCGCPSPDVLLQDLAHGVAPPPPLPVAAYRAVAESTGRGYLSDRLGPTGFRWLRPGRLGGCPKPGLLADLDEDLTALRRVGVTVLISLTLEPLGSDALFRHGLDNVFFPIADRGVPDLADALALAEKVEDWVGRGETVAYHCRAGHGRTGAMLAAQQIWAGASAREALTEVRQVESSWVQSEEQIAFLRGFERAVRAPSPPTGRLQTAEERGTAHGRPQ